MPMSPDEPRRTQPDAVLSTAMRPPDTVIRRATRRLRPRLSTRSSSKSKPTASPAGKLTRSAKKPGLTPSQRPSRPVTVMPCSARMSLIVPSRRGSCQNTTRQTTCNSAKQIAATVATMNVERIKAFIPDCSSNAGARRSGRTDRSGNRVQPAVAPVDQSGRSLCADDRRLGRAGGR